MTLMIDFPLVMKQSVANSTAHPLSDRARRTWLRQWLAPGTGLLCVVLWVAEIPKASGIICPPVDWFGDCGSTLSPNSNSGDDSGCTNQCPPCLSQSPPGTGGPGTTGSGSGLSCGTCGQGSPLGGPTSDEAAMGMPFWMVSEPNMSVWVKDTPVGYQPSRGGPVYFKLFFKNELDEDQVNEQQDYTFFSLGFKWFTPWQCYLSSSDTSNFSFYDGYGGRIAITNGGSASYRWQVTCNVTSGVPTISYTSGALDVFGLQWVAIDSSLTRYFLTARYDAQGNATTFSYTTNSGVLCLSSVTDVDGKSMTLTYANTNWDGFATLSTVTDPFNRQVTLAYDDSEYPNLTSITDAIGLTTTFAYASYNLTNFTTPYGSAAFSGLLGSNYNAGALWVSEQGAHEGTRNHLYMYVDSGTGLPMTNSYAAWLPSTSGSGFSLPNTFDANDSNLRNTFYWNPVQFGLLPSTFVNSLTNGSLATTELNAANFLEARQRHWLTGVNDGTNYACSALSLERAPSPDGVTQGQITWYDYDGKSGGNAENQGTSALPRCVAWLLPGGESRFMYYQRNALGFPTNTFETWDNGSGTVQLRTNNFVYGANNIDLVAVTNAASLLVASNVFNASHEVTTNYDAWRQKTVYTYDASFRLLTVTKPSGLVVSNYYGTNGYVQQTMDLGFRTNTYTWSTGLVYSYTDERGLTVTNTWDNLNRLVKVVYPDGTYTTNVYSNLDLVVKVDRMGLTNQYYFNDFRQVSHAIDPLGRTNSYVYCDCGQLNSMYDALSNATTFSYDYAGRLTGTLYADGFSVTRHYDLLGRLTNVVDSAGTSTTNWFNNQGLVVAASNNVGQVFSAQPDVLDRITSRVDFNGVSVASTYDYLNRLLTRSYPDTGVERFGYTTNVAGLTSYTNQMTNVVLYSYDAEGRKTNEANLSLSTNSFAYDGSGNLLTLVDGKGQQTIWRYDLYSRVTNKVDALGTNAFVYGYDLDNRLTSRTSAAKGTTVYGYDPVGNLTSVTYPSSSNITLKYDPLNRLTNMLDGIGSTAYAYDAVGQLVSEDGPWADDAVSYTYVNRLRTGLSVAAPNSSAWSQSYAYDGAKRLTNVASPAGGFSYAYDTTRKSQIGKLTLPGGASVTNSYDVVARLLTTTLRSSQPATINFHEYGYNTAGQRVWLTNTLGDYWSFAYDTRGQLVGANGYESNGTPRLHEQLGYAYDAAGNLSARTNNALVDLLSMNAANELSAVTNSGTLTVAGTTTSPATSVTVSGSLGLPSGAAALYADSTWARTNATLPNGAVTYTATAHDTYGRVTASTSALYLPNSQSYNYDANGNLTFDDNHFFTYDDENQLVSVEVPASWCTYFAYDGKMRLRERFECGWNGSGWTTNRTILYIYDGNLVIQERSGNNLPAVTYTRGRDLSGSLQGAGGIGGLLGRTDNSVLIAQPSAAHAYYHADGNGNITCLVNGSQAVVARYLYDPYGNTLSQGGPLASANLYRFSSKELHQNSGLIYYGYRFYDPNLQRWPNRDPYDELGFELIRQYKGAFSVGGINLYAFINNAPTAYIDPLGLWRFRNCSQQQQSAITTDLTAKCKAAQANNCFGCLSNNGQKAMNQMCSDSTHDPLQEITFVCEDANTYPDCKSADPKQHIGGVSVPRSRVSHLCFPQPHGYPVGCSALHEAAHSIGGVGNDDNIRSKSYDGRAYQIAKCAGCPQ